MFEKDMIQQAAPRRDGQAEESDRERYTRLLADQENNRKRLQRVYEDRIQQHNEAWMLDLLGVLDNLDRALSYADPDDAIAQGVQLTRQSLWRLLDDRGVEPLDVVGKPFDPAYHEAVELVSAGDELVVLSEVAKGYIYGEKLLRPAMVRVQGVSR